MPRLVLVLLAALLAVGTQAFMPAPVAVQRSSKALVVAPGRSSRQGLVRCVLVWVCCWVD